MVESNYGAKEAAALALLHESKLDEAEKIYRNLIKNGSCSCIVYGNLGAILKIKGDLQNATWFLRKSLEINPDYADGHNNLGIVYKEKGELSAALASYNRALKIRPNYPEVYHNIGIILYSQCRLAEAICHYRKALEFKPQYPDAYYNLGIALHQQGCLDEAIDSYNCSLSLNPRCERTSLNLSLSLLLNGDYKKGWENYEFRHLSFDGKLKSDALVDFQRFICLSDLSPEENIFVVAEQGLGDTLQFMRYVLVLKRYGLKISLCAPKRLHLLIQSSCIDPSPFTIESINTITDGKFIPLMSIPRLLNVSPSNPMITEPYIQSTNRLNCKWHNILAKNGKPIIGFNWRGNRNDQSKQERNISATCFKQVLGVIDANYLCLQRGTNMDEVEKIMPNMENIIHLSESLRIADSNSGDDFLEYAAMISNCDLVITTGSTVSHLAAGLGVSTWVLVPKIPDWRWGMKGDTCFWYPSMRLFRQREHSNWEEVIDRVVVSLLDLFRA